MTRKATAAKPPMWNLGKMATPTVVYALSKSPTSESQDPQEAKNHRRVETRYDQKARPETHAGLRSRGGLHTCSLESPGLNATGGPDTLITVSPCQKNYCDGDPPNTPMDPPTSNVRPPCEACTVGEVYPLYSAQQKNRCRTSRHRHRIDLNNSITACPNPGP